jgi:site-specific recombinase XerD
MGPDEFFHLFRDWLTVHLPRSRRLSANTVRSYKAALNALVAYFRDQQGVPLGEIGFHLVTRSALEAFRRWLCEGQNLAPSSANQRLAAVKSFLGYCAGEDPAPVSCWLEAKQVKPMRTPQRKPDSLAMPLVEALIRAPGQDTRLGIRDTAMVLLLFDSAARVQELLDLTVTDICVEPDSGHVWLTGKGDKTRPVPIMDKTGRHLARYLEVFHGPAPEPGAALFYTVHGGQRHKMSQDNVSYLLNKHARAARAEHPDMPARIHAHQLRHSRAQQMLRDHVPLPHIKEFLGHADIATTMVYASADNQMVREAVQQAASPGPEPAPIWEGDDDLILKLAGLK